MSHGDGRIFLRGSTYWIAYYHRGNEIRESANTSNEKAAKNLLKQRLKERERPNFIGPKEERWTLDDVENKIKAAYIQENNRSFETVEHCFKHLKRLFPYYRVVDITSAEIEKYQTKRLDEGAARSTINLECGYLRHGLRLMHAAKEISEIPSITKLEGETVREGFIKSPDFESLLANIENSDTRDLIEFLYNSAWRSGEGKTLEWREVDVHSWMIKLLPAKSKNKKARLLPVIGALRDIIERRMAVRLLSCPFVFHRNGKPIRSIRRAFKSAAIAAGLGNMVADERTGKEKYVGVTPHDMRRSAVRNFRKAGLSESDGMALSGHLTNSIYKRYNIIDEDDLRESMAKVQKHIKREMSGRKVVPLKKKA